jgi:hypothetical protein
MDIYENEETREFGRKLLNSCHLSKTYYPVSPKNKEVFERSFEFEINIQYQIENFVYKVFFKKEMVLCK